MNKEKLTTIPLRFHRVFADDYAALEPYISAQIMELHHSKHHQTYVNGLNSALDSIAEAESKGDFTKAASVAPLLNFHGGGHLNHSLFWENLAPASRDGGGEPDGALKVRYFLFLPPSFPLLYPVHLSCVLVCVCVCVWSPC
jgi:hypothetical protein